MLNARSALWGSLVLFTAVLPLQAQPQVFGGRMAPLLNSNFSGAAPYTLVNLADRINADGTLTAGSIAWQGSGCANAFKLKVLRPANLSSFSFTFVGERGPFNVSSGLSTFNIDPIAVKKGDVIAISILQPNATCGTIRAAVGASQEGYFLFVTSEINASGVLAGSLFRNTILPFRVTDSKDVVEGVIAAAGSLAGGFGSFFRTSLQMGAPSPSFGATTGKLVFHRAGVAASASDPSLPFTIPSEGNLSFDDVVATMGQSGLGTLDIVVSTGQPPFVTSRIYNDAGTAGTSGFTEEMLRPSDALHVGDTATMLTPSDLTNFRVNIGVRTFGGPVTLNLLYGTRGGAQVVVPANTFQQTALTAFTSVQPQAGERIFFTVADGGDAIIYASTTDNRTNDSNVFFLRRQ